MPAIYNPAMFFATRPQLALLVSLLVLSTKPSRAQDIKSLPLDPQVYRQIIGTRGRMPEPQRLDQLIAQYRGEFQIERVDTTEVNGHRAATASRSPEKLEVWQTISAVRVQAIRSLDPSKLDDAARRDWRVLRDRFETDALSYRADLMYASPTYHRVRMPFGNFVQSPQTRADYEDRLAWLRGVKVALEGYEATLRNGLAAGVTDSRANVSAAIAEMRAAVPEDAQESAYLEPFKTFPASMPPDEQKQLTDDALRIYRNDVVPAYNRYLAFVEQTYLPSARPSHLPGASTAHARYTLSMRRVTGLQVDPAGVHEAALAEVSRLHNELSGLARKNAFAGSGAEYLIAIRKDPKCAPLDAPTAKREFDAQMLRVESALPRLFAVVPSVRTEFEPAPDLPFVVGEAVPVAGSAKEGRPGRVRVKVPVTNTCGFLTVMRHEGVPGHLFQNHIAAQSDVAAARRIPGGPSAYLEGWAEYASDLAAELGLELDAYAQAARIGGRIFMAARTVVDTGVNWHGWTSEKATAYYRGAAPWAPVQVVESVVKTAFDTPARQAMYFVGARRMHELRDYATKELGVKFDVRRFHDEILKYGPLPLGVLEEQIREWVAHEKTSK